MRIQPKRTVETKKDGKWVQSDYIEQDGMEVYKHLAEDLTWKYVKGAAWVKRVKRTSNYDGSQKIVVTYSNDVRATYVIDD